MLKTSAEVELTRLEQLGALRGPTADSSAPRVRVRTLRCRTSGAKGIRTPDPHTASVVRYQLRHSPVKLCQSKLHHLQQPFKVSGHGTSPPASGPRARAGVGCVGGRPRVSGASVHPSAATSRMTPLVTKAQLNDVSSAICPTASEPRMAPRSAII